MVNAMCDSVIDFKENEKHEKNVYNLEKEILKTVLPNIWNVHVKGNMERKIEVDFRLYAVSVIDYLNVDLETISVFNFYTSVKYLKDKFKKK